MNIPIVMIVGPPRSGTTLLGNLLGLHPQISTIIEPYYIWDRHFREAPHDQFSENDASLPVIRQIRGSFGRYLRATGTDFVIDKSPRNSLKIPFIRAVFPEARFIIIRRDPRDTILSVQARWKRRGAIFGGEPRKKHLQDRLRIYRKWLVKRPFTHLRVQSLLFELGPPRYWLRRRFLNRLRWQGRFGWGPRFKGWQEMIDRVSLLEFNAYQWLYCARGIINSVPRLPGDKVFTLRYEDLIRETEVWLKKIFSFLGMGIAPGFFSLLPPIWSDNADKWPHAFSMGELKTIGPIISRELMEWGYADDESWFRE